MQREPMFNVPAPVLWLLAVFAVVHGAREFMPAEAADRFIIAMALIPARYTSSDYDIPGGEWAGATSLVTHIFTHADLTHLLINSAWLLAFGSILARRIGAARFYLLALCGGLAGAFAYLAGHWGQPTPVIGASGAIAALMGAVMRFIFVAIDQRQGYLLREDPAAIPLMPLSVALTDRRIVVASALFIGVNLLALIGFGSFGSNVSAIAWEAHVGGYVFGLLAFGAFDVAPQKSLPSVSDLD